MIDDPAYHRAWRVAHPDRAAVYARRWRLRHPEEHRQAQQRQYQRRKLQALRAAMLTARQGTL